MAHSEINPLAAHAFRMRRLDRITCQETAELLGIPEWEVERIVRKHEEQIGCQIKQKSCGRARVIQERAARAVRLYLAGATPAEVRELVGYRQATNEVRRLLRRALEGEQIKHGRVVVSKGKNETPILTAPKAAIRLSSFEVGQEVFWRILEERIVVTRRPSRQPAGNSPRRKSSAPRGISAELLELYAEAYDDYMADWPLQGIAEAQEISPHGALHRAKRYAQLMGLPWQLRRPENADSGILRVSKGERLVFNRAVHAVGWPPGTPVLWRVPHSHLITMQRFVLDDLADL